MFSKPSNVLLCAKKISWWHVLHCSTCSRITTNQFEHLVTRGQSGVCKFIIECPTLPSLLCDSVTRGLADQDIQLDIMGDRNQNMNLEEIFQLVEAKESGKWSASRLLHAQTQGAEAASSSYRRHKKENLINKYDLDHHLYNLIHGPGQTPNHSHS